MSKIVSKEKLDIFKQYLTDVEHDSEASLVGRGLYVTDLRNILNMIGEYERTQYYITGLSHVRTNWYMQRNHAEIRKSFDEFMESGGYEKQLLILEERKQAREVAKAKHTEIIRELMEPNADFAAIERKYAEHNIGKILSDGYRIIDFGWKDFLDIRKKWSVYVQSRNGKFLSDRAAKIHQQKREEIKDYAKDVVQLFVESKISREKFLGITGIRSYEFDSFLEITEEKFPGSDLPARATKFMRNNMTQYFTLMLEKAQKIVASLDQQQPYTALDYYANHVQPLEDFNSFIQRSNFEPELKRKIKTFFHQNSAGLKQMVSLKQVVNEKTIIGGREVDPQEKAATLDYLRQNKMPQCLKLYNLALKHFLNHGVFPEVRRTSAPEPEKGALQSDILREKMDALRAQHHVAHNDSPQCERPI